MSRYSLRRGRRLPPTTEAEEFVFVHNCNVKKEIKPPHWIGKLKKSSSN
jgi:hypothetical protein